MQDLQQISMQWRTALDALSELVALLDENGCIIRANRTVEEWGLSRVQEVPGQDFHELMHPDGCEDGCLMLWAWRQLAEIGEDRIEIESEFTSLGGRTLRTTFRRLAEFQDDAISVANSLDLRKRIWAAVIVEDVTKDRDLSRRASRRTRLETTAHLIRGFAHEVGNPLASVRTAVQVLEHYWTQFDDSKKLDYLRRVLDATDRIRSVVDRSLSSHLWTLGPLEDLAISDLVDGIRTTYAARALDRNIEFRSRGAIETGESILAERDAAITVLEILLDNAFDAVIGVGGVGIVTVDVLVKAAEIEVRISDTGPGIEPADLRHIFQPFYGSKPGGTGLSMSHADHLLDQMRGRIEVDSRGESGTTVIAVFRRST